MTCIHCERSLAEGDPACPHCGWNLAAAWITEQLGAALTFALFGLAAWFLFVVR